MLSPLILVCVIAASCSSSETAGEPTTSSAVDQTSSTSGVEAGSNSGETDAEGFVGPITMWVPSSLALATFIEVAVADAPFSVDVIEHQATYDETVDAARAALGADYLVVVPATIGAALVESGDGFLGARLFEDEDPDLAATQLGVWVLRSEFVSFLGFARGQTPSSDTQEVVEFVVAEEVAYMDSLEQGLKFKTGGAAAGTIATVVIESAETFGTRGGGSVAIRGVAKFAGPVAAVLDFLKTTHDFTVAAMDMIEAESNEIISLYDTGMSTAAIISDANRKLTALKEPLISGDVTAEDAQELVGALQRTVARASNLAVEASIDLEDLGEEASAAQINQLRERHLAEFNRTAADVIDEIDARPSESSIVAGPGVDRIIDGSSRFAIDGNDVDPLEAFAQMLTGVEAGNMSTHSNGRQTKTSEGGTDIIAIGQGWWAPTIGGATLDQLLPCGSGDSGVTLCGGGTYDGSYVVAIANFGDLVAADSPLIYQYAWVFDRDNDPGDNYIAGGAFPKDTWDQSDIRYEVTSRDGVLGLNVTEGPNFTVVDSAARVHVEANQIVALIPDPELGVDPDGSAVPMRVTSFWHRGDFGQGPDEEYNLDVFPVVGEPYWTPNQLVSATGPSGQAADLGPLEGVDRTVFDNQRQAVLDGLGGFASVAVGPEDPSPMKGVDECFANEYFFDNSTVLSLERNAFEYDGTSVQVRFELHDSESAARGAFGFSSSTVSLGCRMALIEGPTVSIEAAVRPVSGPSLVVDRFELGGDGEGLITTTFVAYDGSTALRISTVGPPGSGANDMILGTIEDFAAGP
ncbi:hypothetical protein JYT71_00595 [Acidimicrobiaceae bacterium AH-315-P05]|nr:hypothetical protein [Acidimicrobiaceae bacterium AH-315-P05]